MQIIPQSHFYLLVLSLLVIRLFHLGGEIDLPHDWRQCDTAHYIEDFYQNGIDILYPAVCWMGNHETIIFECPLPEAIVALIMKATGEGLFWQRLVFVLFFCLALYCLYQCLFLIFGHALAQWSVLVYLVLPHL